MDYWEFFLNLQNPNIFFPLCSLEGFFSFALHVIDLTFYKTKIDSKECMCAKLLQLCLTLGAPGDCSLPGSPVHRTLQARILEWVAMHRSNWDPSGIPRIKPTSLWSAALAGSFLLASPGRPHGFQYSFYLKLLLFSFAETYLTYNIELSLSYTKYIDLTHLYVSEWFLTQH